MRNRREFITTATGAAVGMLAGGSGLLDARAPALLQVGAKPGKRREVTIAGKRVKTVDLHAHCFVPEVMGLIKDTPLAEAAKGNLGLATLALGNPQRLIDMDAQGVDYQAINVNAWGYNADKALARDLVALQNERISQYCAKNPDRFVGVFRSTTPRLKLLQNLLQSREIRFGDAMEEIIAILLSEMGFVNQDKRFLTSEDDDLSADQYFCSSDKTRFYLMEQKVRDDHDSTKK